MTSTTGSHTLMSALAGASFAGFATAIVYALALGPWSGAPFGIAEVALAFLCGALFGTIAGFVAGASEVEVAPLPKHEAQSSEDAPAPARPIRREPRRGLDGWPREHALAVPPHRASRDALRHADRRRLLRLGKR
ncbi:MAG TPA: hypothetical protein VFG69_04755 [Nannocystaceae bacterium]|nr:hypothetical protein [Nannocystaceae bacterium]